mmetsp:Transcript_25098/g.28680  ORF Transcript_25098/g.28680 Transcript_25098/m.28680 type:complete len:514 (-) Transcript_25098:297-1838(-)
MINEFIQSHVDNAKGIEEINAKLQAYDPSLFAKEFCGGKLIFISNHLDSIRLTTIEVNEEKRLLLSYLSGVVYEPATKLILSRMPPLMLKLDVEEVTSIEKQIREVIIAEDGTSINMFWYDGEWRITSRKMENFSSVKIFPKSWRVEHIIKFRLQNLGIPISKLNKRYSYTLLFTDKTWHRSTNRNDLIFIACRDHNGNFIPRVRCGMKALNTLKKIPHVDTSRLESTRKMGLILKTYTFDYFIGSKIADMRNDILFNRGYESTFGLRLFKAYLNEPHKLMEVFPTYFQPISDYITKFVKPYLRDALELEEEYFENHQVADIMQDKDFDIDHLKSHIGKVRSNENPFSRLDEIKYMDEIQKIVDGQIRRKDTGNGFEGQGQQVGTQGILPGNQVGVQGGNQIGAQGGVPQHYQQNRQQGNAQNNGLGNPNMMMGAGQQHDEETKIPDLAFSMRGLALDTPEKGTNNNEGLFALNDNVLDWLEGDDPSAFNSGDRKVPDLQMNPGVLHWLEEDQ